MHACVCVEECETVMMCVCTKQCESALHFLLSSHHPSYYYLPYHSHPSPSPLPSLACPTAAVTVEFKEESYTDTAVEIYVNISVVLLGNIFTLATVHITGEYEGADGFSTLNFTVEVELLLPTEVPIFVGADGIYNPNAK